MSVPTDTMQRLLDKVEDLEKKIDTLTVKTAEEEEEEAEHKLLSDVDACRDFWGPYDPNAPGI